MKNQSIAKVAITLLKNMGDCGFSDSLGYRTRAHRTNNEQLEAAICEMLATLHTHKEQGVDVSGPRLRVNGLGKAKSKAQMNWQVDDLLNYLLGLVDKAEQERALPKLRQAVIGGKVVCQGEVVTVIDLDFNNGFAKVSFVSGRVETVMGCQIALMATPFPTCINPEDKPKVTYCHGASGSMYRITEGKEKADILIDGHIWRESPTGAEYLLSAIANGRATEQPEPELIESVIRVKPAQPAPKPYTEATDPETGHTYRVDSHGRILVRQAGGHSFYAGNCNVYVVKAVIRLGLINDDRE